MIRLDKIVSQFAYQHNHSINIGLSKLSQHFEEKNKVTGMALLDRNEAFDTIDHSVFKIVLKRSLVLNVLFILTDTIL